MNTMKNIESEDTAAEMIGKPLESCNFITCHLGNGSSVTCIRHGKSLDTTMGFTPLEGLIMGTRSGDIDPAIVTFIMEKEDLNPSEMNNILNKKLQTEMKERHLH